MHQSKMSIFFGLQYFCSAELISFFLHFCRHWTCLKQGSRKFPSQKWKIHPFWKKIPLSV